MKTYFIKTYGCQMNVSDSERIAGVLKKTGYAAASKMNAADLIVFVACSVRQSAMDRIYGQVRQFTKTNAQRQTPTTILTGCLLEKDKKELSKKFDLIFNIKNLPKLPKLIRDLQLKTYDLQPDGKKNFYFKITPCRSSAISAFVPVMTGCDNYCSYCVVPYARGPEISRPAEDIVKEVNNLVKGGYKEITLLGQNVNSYSIQIKHKFNTDYTQKRKLSLANKNNNDFPELLRKINAIPGDFWLRFMTSHPKDMSDELIQTVSECEKICEHVHLPAQSGDNEILKKMNRKYTIARYTNLIKKIRRQIPGVAISTDIIVGFPGETKKQFQNTAKLMCEIKFDMAYLAQYSPRAQTAAYKLEDNVPKKEKKRREKILAVILTKTALENNKKYIGRTVEILVDSHKVIPPPRAGSSQRAGKSLNHGENFQKIRVNSCPNSCQFAYSGKTRTGKNVKIIIETSDGRQGNKGKNKFKIGDFATVRIIRATPWGLEGKII